MPLSAAGLSEPVRTRDIFDLDLLLRRSPLAGGAIDAGTRRAAVERGLELPYSAFVGQDR